MRETLIRVAVLQRVESPAMPLKLFLFVPPKQPEPDALSELRRLRRVLWADGRGVLAYGISARVVPAPAPMGRAPISASCVVTGQVETRLLAESIRRAERGVGKNVSVVALADKVYVTWIFKEALNGRLIANGVLLALSGALLKVSGLGLPAWVMLGASLALFARSARWCVRYRRALLGEWPRWLDDQPIG